MGGGGYFPLDCRGGLRSACACGQAASPGLRRISRVGNRGGGGASGFLSCIELHFPACEKTRSRAHTAAARALRLPGPDGACGRARRRGPPAPSWAAPPLGGAAGAMHRGAGPRGYARALRICREPEPSTPACGFNGPGPGAMG